MTTTDILQIHYPSGIAFEFRAPIDNLPEFVAFADTESLAVYARLVIASDSDATLAVFFDPRAWVTDRNGNVLIHPDREVLRKNPYWHAFAVTQPVWFQKRPASRRIYNVEETIEILKASRPMEAL